jgi:hypothetical protein
MTTSHPISRSDLRIRDPYIVVHQGYYLMYAQAANRARSGYTGVEVYVSDDLVSWSDPTPVLILPDSRVEKVWAPEMHFHDGAWHLLVTLTFSERLPWRRPDALNGIDWPEPRVRGTWHYRSSSPLGPFDPTSGRLLTPANDGALDGTLYHDDTGSWLVYCQEWLQVVDGLMVARRLDRGLAPTADPPITLFRASDAPCAPVEPTAGKITDGPFMFKCANSASLFMLWSTNDGSGTYVLLAAESPNGSILGPWSGQHVLLHSNGGHGMIFTDLAGRTCIAVHEPNTGEVERLRLLLLDVKGSIPKIIRDA